ncbi:Probable cobalt transporter subunit (CbtB) [Paracoccus halophilus]|uniref:Cobalt transporter n=1 Tax=Paracoccus halophilus TaxID=376733 RepID=A0A099EXL8_9RHOB|nr:CbtB domain-containing protein [Paracoccus halophilus]KGJ03170.1 cobalt transporter [Paracoccus halophilus]SFA59193.1 Probable cobalt transporter subunit (CbtB) [Paracoccus halophilus]
MSDNTTIPALAPQPFPLREVTPWAIFGLIIGLIALYFIGLEQGALALFEGATIHEFVHDARHLLGFPCH